MSDEELAKDIGPLAALTIGVGTMVGAGIFVLPGPAVAELGPLAALAFVIGGGIAILTALSASELGTAMPVSGGAYYYINQGLGPLFGSIAGWGNWLGLAFASAFYMYGFGAYVNEFISMSSLVIGPVELIPAQVIGLFGAVFFIAVNAVGAKETGRLQNIIVITLVAILAVFTFFGVLNAELDTLTPVDPFGWAPLLPVTGLVFVSYLGFVQIASVGEEIKDPGRNLPRAIIGSVVIVTSIYALTLLAVLAAVETDVVAGNETAVVDVAQILMGPLGAAALLFGGLLATASSANASILASARINFAMGRDKIVTDWLNAIHPRFSTPYRSILLTGAIIVGLLLTLGQDLEMLATAASILHLIVYALMNFALIVFREADVPDYEPDFRVPFYPFTPIVGAILSIALIAFLEPYVIGLSMAFVVGAMLWYGLYARKKVTDAGLLSKYVLSRSEEMPDAAVSAAEAASPDEAGPDRIMVPIANPRTEDTLIDLAGTLADERDGIVHAVHIVQVPDQTALERAEAAGAVDAESERLLEQARKRAEERDVEIETSTILSHRSFEEVFDAARRYDADTVVMGWGEDRPWAAGRAERPIDELTANLPCDFLVLKDRDFDASEILFPTAGGPDSDLGAEVVRSLRSAVGADVRLLHVVSDESEREAGETFLEEWAEAHDLETADLEIDTSGDVEGAIARESADRSLVVIGATERGLLSRLVNRSLVFDVVDEVDCSVLLAERPTDRTVRERLFGRE